MLLKKRPCLWTCSRDKSETYISVALSTLENAPMVTESLKSFDLFSVFLYILFSTLPYSTSFIPPFIYLLSFSIVYLLFSFVESFPLFFYAQIFACCAVPTATELEAKGEQKQLSWMILLPKKY